MELVRERSKKYIWLLLAAAILLLYPYVTVFASGIGGFMSEKLIGRSGVDSSSLVV